MSHTTSVRKVGALLTSAAAVIAMSSSPAFAAGGGHHVHNNVVNPYSPAYGHQYRHGAFPTRGAHQKMKGWQITHNATTAATGSQTLSYGGGAGNTNNTGVTSGHEKVYVVVYGNQWGTSSTDANGNMTLSGDQLGAVPYLEKMFKDLGTGNEGWSGVLTQYCDGPGVATGATSCPSSAAHVGYPTGGAFSGIWYDNSVASPTQATGAQLANVAISAAQHFGNTTAASNRYAQYVILSPSGTHPDGFNTSSGNFCAWHDWNGDQGVSSPVGDVAFTNMPYVADAGSSCGKGSVNGASGDLDGFSIVEGHEYAETVTDQNPAGGWTNHVTGSSYNGQENGDECAWITSGQGATQNVQLGTGTFPMQSTWSNDTNECDITHAIIGGGGSTSNTVTVTTPASQTGTVGTAESLQVQASDSDSTQTLTYSATGLPAGESINSSTGLISGTPTTAGTYSPTVTATDGTGATGSATFTWTVNSAPTGGCSGQLLANPGFESGNTAWTTTSGVIGQFGAQQPAHSGTWNAWMDGYGTTHTDYIQQSISIPAGCKATLSYYVHIDTAETTTSTAYDTMTVSANGSTLQTMSNLDAGSGYQLKTVDLSAYAGQTVTLKFTGTEDVSNQTSFVLDDTAVNLG